MANLLVLKIEEDTENMVRYSITNSIRFSGDIFDAFYDCDFHEELYPYYDICKDLINYLKYEEEFYKGYARLKYHFKRLENINKCLDFLNKQHKDNYAYCCEDNSIPNYIITYKKK